MNAATIGTLIQNKNAKLEREALQSAEQIIEEIIEMDGIIKTAQKQIIELREQLRALEVKSIDPKTVIGE